MSILSRADWLNSENIRPYVFVRPENQIAHPGTRHHLNWFNSVQPILKNPLHLSELPFADAIYQIEWKSFGHQDLAIPRWVFYDCAAMPGFIAGFAAKTESLDPEILSQLSFNPPSKESVFKGGSHEWCPLSLFVIIPTMHKGEWVAYDLCSVNSFLSKEKQFYGLGFLSKAFALWYANVDQCSGMTQWGSPSLKLHSHYGHLEVIGSYAPLHTHAKTMTYRCEVNTDCWEKFFTKEQDLAFLEKYGPSGYQVDPTDEKSMIDFQLRIQNNEGPFYLSAQEIAIKNLTEKLMIYHLKKER
jgi:hypothetical protein